MRSMFVISVVILVCFIDHSYGTFMDFLSNLPTEISKAFSIAWESMEDAIKHPVRIHRIGPGGKLKTTTVRPKPTTHREQPKTEFKPDQQINWLPKEQSMPIAQRIDWQLKHQLRINEFTNDLKRKHKWQPDQQLEVTQKPELERPLEWQNQWQPQQKLDQNHHELIVGWQPQQSSTRKSELHTKRQPWEPMLRPEWQPDQRLDQESSQEYVPPSDHESSREYDLQSDQESSREFERQSNQALSREYEQQIQLNSEKYEFSKYHNKPVIPFLKNRPSSNIMRLFQSRAVITED
ncbi:hypothetical protein PYW07_016906 [Mythimna separata]|uniref:Uncharacterized protein n=1 Tax=Mythimna separata TaxID=271217 RepID=A0AAD7YVN8_MYTSE|nr:hypothetical protein PYW07_016906 [Mythimna separata]